MRSSVRLAALALAAMSLPACDPAGFWVQFEGGRWLVAGSAG